MYLDIKVIEHQAKYQEAFLETSVKEAKWALDIYESIVLENAKKPKESS